MGCKLDGANVSNSLLLKYGALFVLLFGFRGFPASKRLLLPILIPPFRIIDLLIVLEGVLVFAVLGGDSGVTALFCVDDEWLRRDLASLSLLLTVIVVVKFYSHFLELLHKMHMRGCQGISLNLIFLRDCMNRYSRLVIASP